MKNIRVFLSENFQFLEVKFSIYLNSRVFVMKRFVITDHIRPFVFSMLVLYSQTFNFNKIYVQK